MSSPRQGNGFWRFLFRNVRQSDDGDALLRSGQSEGRAPRTGPSHGESESELVIDIPNDAGGASSSRSAEQTGANIADPEPGRGSTSSDAQAIPDTEISKEEVGNDMPEAHNIALCSSGSSVSSDASATCLICLEPLDPSDSRNTVHLGCMCKGAAAYRHKACLDQWLNVKGDTKCDVCGAEMKVPLPPPPPVPGYVIFPDLEHTFEVQWAMFGRYVWQNAVAVVVYCVVLALIMDIPLQIAMLIAAIVLGMIMVRYIVSVTVNSIARRTVLSFQVPESS